LWWRHYLNGSERTIRRRVPGARPEKSLPKLSHERKSKSDSFLLKNQDRRSYHHGPQAALVANRRLRNIGCADDFVKDPVDLLLFIPGFVRIKLHVQGSGEHLRRQFLRILSSHIVRFAEGMMLAEVAIGASVGRDGQTNTGGNQPMR